MWLQRKPHSPHQEIDRELRYHFDHLVRDYVAAGLDEAEARRRARLEFGGPIQIREDVRDARGHLLSDLAQDLRYASRTLRRSPAFLAVSVLSLALGIGANTAIFSLIDALMLRPLPVPGASRVVQPNRVELSDNSPGRISLSLYEYLRRHMKTVSSYGARTEDNVTVVIDGVEEDLTADLVTADFFRALGIRAAAGRLLGAIDDVPSPAAPAAVLSYAYWQRRFSGNPAIIGKTIAIPALHRNVEIVGVAEAAFTGVQIDRNPDITLPVSFALTEPAWREPRNSFLEPIARLAPGRSIQEADAELQVLWKAYTSETAPQIPAAVRDEFLRRRGAVLSAAHGFSPLRDRYSKPLLLLMGMVALVLLLACVNLSGLLLARATARQREISIRLAIGAGANRLVRQFLAESLLLAALGGSLGLILAGRLSRALVVALGSARLDLFVSTAPDWRVLAFTTVISLAACILAGLAPGWNALRTDLNRGTRAQPRMHPKMGSTLVVAQISLSMVLIVGAALFGGTLVKLIRANRGFQAAGVLTFDLKSSQQYSRPQAFAAIAAVEAALKRLPGVASASAVRNIPISGYLTSHTVSFDDASGTAREESGIAYDSVGPDYFSTIGMPLLAGRAFNLNDTDSSPKVAIITQNLARDLAGAHSPVGLVISSIGIPYRIVGVVGDSKYLDLRHGAMRALYVPWTQTPPGAYPRYSFLLRSARGDPRQFVPVLDSLVRAADPDLRVSRVQTYDELISRSIVSERVMAALGGFFGALALLIAGIGVFGLMAFQISRRTAEIGVRMALGAARGNVVKMVLREVAIMAVAGCTLGGAAALSLTGLTRKMLFGVTPADPGVFAIAAAVLLSATLAAAWLPARRASRIDPVTAIRHD